jgi:glycosyltransferase involved in cell wall biosynthesis
VTGRILFILKGYPRLSETFIAQEIRTLEKRGFRLSIASLRHPTDKRAHPVVGEIAAPVSYLPEYLHEEPLRVWRGFLKARRMPGFAACLDLFWKDLRRDVTRNRVRRLGQACVLVAELPPDIVHLHAHFIHTPASVARYASIMTGLSWTCSAHAKDIWTTPEWDLREKLREMRWAVTCTKAGRATLAGLAPNDDTVRLVYHGLDLSRFPPLIAPASERDGRNPDKPVRLLTVARAVEKKGLDALLAALSQLPADLAWRWSHIGGGPLTDALKGQAKQLGIADRITFRGSQDQTAVIAAYCDADLFVLPCRIGDDGDRDGLPNVLVEAASQGLALLSTPVSGVPEFIVEGETGALTPPDDAAALATAIEALARDPARRYRLAKMALDRVRRSFDHDATVGELDEMLRQVAPRAAIAAKTNTVRP